LQGGDQVEIITSEKQKPNISWLNFVTTSKAKTKLKTAFHIQRKELAKEGKVYLKEILDDAGIQLNKNIFQKLYRYYNTHNKEEIYLKIGEDKPNKELLLNIIKKQNIHKYIKFWNIEKNKITNAVKKFNKSKPLIVDDNTDNYTIATCCNPIPGDDVIGYKVDDDELIIHNTSCPNAIRLNSSESENVVKVEWNSKKILAFLGKISLNGIDDIGVVNEITNLISKEFNVNMKYISFESFDGIFKGLIHIYVHNTDDLNKIIEHLSKVEGISQVSRI
jgi:GTP pyrophosphokinase